MVGASWIAGDRVIPALRAAGQQIEALVSASGDHARSFAEEHQIDSVVADVADIADDVVDAVYVGNLNDQHLPAVRYAASRGWHVLVEKPMAETESDAEAMVAACESAGVVLAVNHHLVASAAVQAVRAAIESGAVGVVKAVRVMHAKLLPEFLRTWRTGDGPGSGVVPDLTPHDVSVVHALIGECELTEVTAAGVRQSGWPGASIDAVGATIVYDNDLLVTLHDAFTTPHAMTGVEILGERGAIWAEDLMDPDPIARIRLTTDDGAREIDYEPRDVYEATVRAFVAATAGEGRPYVDGNAGLSAARVAHAVERAVAR